MRLNASNGLCRFHTWALRVNFKNYLFCDLRVLHRPTAAVSEDVKYSNRLEIPLQVPQRSRQNLGSEWRQTYPSSFRHTTGRFLVEQLDSIEAAIKPTSLAVEVIVMDDGSTDGSPGWPAIMPRIMRTSAY